MSSSEQVVVTRSEHVCEVRLNRPEKRNALTSNMYEALVDCLRGRGGRR